MSNKRTHHQSEFKFFFKFYRFKSDAILSLIRNQWLYNSLCCVCYSHLQLIPSSHPRTLNGEGDALIHFSAWAVISVRWVQVSFFLVFAVLNKQRNTALLTNLFPLNVHRQNERVNENLVKLLQHCFGLFYASMVVCVCVWSFEGFSQRIFDLLIWLQAWNYRRGSHSGVWCDGEYENFSGVTYA